MKPITRKEYYLAKAAGIYTGPTPPPVLREDYYLATLAGDYSGNCPAPMTRLEKYMSAAAGITSYVPYPVTRIEKYWYAIAKGTGYVPEPITREERFLYALVPNKPEPPKPEYVDKTAEGSTILLTDSAEASFTALTLYGKSTQDGTPSPENPVPIVSAGDNGEINVSVSDGGTQSQTLTLSTPGGLPGIPVSSGGNYTDENGQQWVCDEIDLARGKCVKRVGIETINGGYNFFETQDNPGRFLQSVVFTNLYKNGRYESICNIALWRRWGIGKDDTAWVFAMSQADLYLNPPTASGITTADELNAFLNSLEFPVVFVGQLETPIETDLPAEEIAAYKAMHTYSPATTVSNDAAAWMKVGYKATP